MKSVSYSICETQGAIYRCVNRRNLSLPVFSDQYLHSRFCTVQMDAVYSHFQLADAEECLDFILPEIEIPSLPEPVYTDQVAYWIGFMYRYLFFSLHLPSNRLADTLSFQAMTVYYPGLHTVDEDMAVEIIRHDFFDGDRKR